MLTPALLSAALQIRSDRAAFWAPRLRDALAVAEVDTPQRLACFLAQIGHESGRLRFTREIWGPTAQQLRYEPPTTLAARLGNTQPGDGRRFMGRGLVQVTGRWNYANTTKRLREIVGESAPNLVRAPALLEEPDLAALSAAIFWRDRGLNRFADAFDFVGLTRRLNGGTFGLAERQTLYTLARAAIAAHA